MEINFDELHKICDILFQQIRDKGYDSIIINADYYWNIPQTERYEPCNKPSHLDIGQLSDDWGELQKVITAQEEPFGYNFVWLSTILRAIGEVIVL